ncbi:hypothetical protein J4Q44_G00048740 [Coregonus suidteri]|uniref:Uncharacterized protein n=1 Tax=Coregonus suidteri TaxID=861788 RepID=A0AAN8MGR2_9TELE
MSAAEHTPITACHLPQHHASTMPATMWAAGLSPTSWWSAKSMMGNRKLTSDLTGGLSSAAELSEAKMT